MKKIVRIVKQGNMYNVFVRECNTGTEFSRYGSINKIEALAYAYGYCDAFLGDVILLDEELPY